MDEHRRLIAVDHDRIADALHLLAAVFPLFANVLWLHKVEQYTEVDISRMLGKHERQIRKLINGYHRDGKEIWGARQWFEAIVILMMSSDDCSDSDEVGRLIAFSQYHNPWTASFPGAALDVLLEALEANVLCCILGRLREARRNSRYDGLILKLLERYDGRDLEIFFAELCPPQDVIKGSKAPATGQAI